MKEKVKLFKQELLNHIKDLSLEDIGKSLDGRDGIRRSSPDINGFYCSNVSGDGINVIGKSGLIITLSIDKGYEEDSEMVFENTQEYEDGMEFQDWDGTWEIELDEHSGIQLLLRLSNL